MRIKFERQLLVRFVLVAVISLVIEVASYINSARAIESGQRVTEAHAVLGRLDQVASMMKDAETGARGFLLSGSQEQLRLFNAALGGLGGELNKLDDIVRGNRQQRASAARLNELVALRIEGLRVATGLKHNGRDAEAAAIVQSRDGQRSMDEIRTLILGMRGDAERLLMGRELRADLMAQGMAVLSWAGLIANIFVLAFSYRLVARELKMRRDAERRLNELANIDPLTGLHNRRSVAELLRIAYARAARHSAWLSVVMLDIDFFKSYNDTYGHPAGDELLRTTGSLLRSLVRVDDYVGRYGGEEFIVLLPDTNAEMACVVAERIRAGIEESGRARCRLTVSLGVATLSARTTSIEALVEQSDKALYRSKQEGRNRVSHYDGLEPVTLPISIRYESSVVRAG